MFAIPLTRYPTSTALTSLSNLLENEVSPLDTDSSESMVTLTSYASRWSETEDRNSPESNDSIEYSITTDDVTAYETLIAKSSASRPSKACTFCIACKTSVSVTVPFSALCVHDRLKTCLSCDTLLNASVLSMAAFKASVWGSFRLASILHA